MFIKSSVFLKKMRNFTGRNKDKWEKALSHDKHALGVFKEDGSLIGLIPIELSNPIDYFLIDAEENFGSGVAVPKIHEVRLVVPVKFTTITKQLRVTTILLEEVLNASWSKK